MSEVSINIKSQEINYPIIIENEAISDLKEKILKFINERKYIVIISSKVEKLYGKNLDFENKFVLKDGEKEKNFKNLQKILNFALKNKLDRKSVFVAIVGGKTAIDTDFGKNLIGSFYQPKIVFVNPKFLKTLDNTQFMSGLGEVIKYAFIEKSTKCDEEFNLINILNEKDIFSKDEKYLSKIIEICIKLKKSVVEKDEKESNLRRILNFGHTYGHAIEKINNYKKYTHGEAVIEGIKYVFKIALEKNIIDKNYYFFAMDVIKKFNFRNIPEYKKEKMIKFMLMDKKAQSGKIVFVLPCDYSTVKICEFSKDEF